MGIIEWNPVLEALLFAAGDEGLSLEQISAVLEVSKREAKEIIQRFADSYHSETRGIQMIEMAGVYQLTTKKNYASYLQRLVEAPREQTLSQAALETLAIVAYRQPITRMEIEAIRGVKAERALHSLAVKVLIKEVGRSESVGRPILYGTTNEFLDYFGLKSLKELPVLSSETEEDLAEEEKDLFYYKYEEKESAINGDN